MLWKYRFGKEIYIKQIHDIGEWQKRLWNSADWQKKAMSEIYLLNACKLDWEENIFVSYVESIAVRIKILINVTLIIINKNHLFNSQLNIAVTMNF